MLRQAVRLLLEQHKRLTYSSLQGIVRRMHTLNISEAQVRNGSLVRNYSHNVYLRYVHSTGVKCKDQKDRKYEMSINVGEETEDYDKSGVVVQDKLSDTVALHDDIVKFKDECETSLHKNKSDLRNFINKYDSDADNDDNFFDVGDDDTEVGRELVPLKRQELKTVRKNREKSLVTANTYYKPKSITRSLLDEEEAAVSIVSSETYPELARLEEEYNLELAEKGLLKVPGVQKVEIPSLTDVGPIVNDTEVLQKLVQLRVDLSVVQQKEMIGHVLNMNFKKDVAPYILILKDIGVPEDKLGEVITKIPWIFEHDVENLRVRLDYLRSKKFTRSQIGNMIDKDPKFLLVPVEVVDAKLGFLQQEFRLTGQQLREKVSGLSKLLVVKPAVIKETKFYMKKFLGFTENELQTIFLGFPKIFMIRLDVISNSFDYLHNVMELPHELIAKNPLALKKTHPILESRHRFLVKCGRAQYDPQKPNYVSLFALFVPSEDKFCVEVAKASVAEYNQFLRTI